MANLEILLLAAPRGWRLGPANRGVAAPLTARATREVEGRMRQVASDVLGAAAVTLAFVALYLAAYWGSLHYLRPYAGYYSYAIACGLRAYNLEMLAIFLASPFDAYEAVMLGVDPLLYFANGVVIPTLIMLISLYVSYFVPLLLPRGAGQANPSLAAGLTRAAARLLACALADSYAASLAIWAWLGAPGVRVSVYSAFAIAASAYLLALLAYQLAASAKPAGRARARLVLAALSASAGAAALIYVWAWRYVPAVPMWEHVNHLVGYVGAVPMAYWSVEWPRRRRGSRRLSLHHNRRAQQSGRRLCIVASLNRTIKRVSCSKFNTAKRFMLINTT